MKRNANMSRFHVVAGVVALSGVMSACRPNPKFCDDHPNNNCDIPIVDTPTGCSSDQECSTPTPACNLPDSTCVQCTTTNTTACSGDTPVCSDEHTCSGCTSHAQCPSQVCLASGACAEDAQVAYVSTSGAGTTCSKLAPCPLLKDALAKNLSTVKIAADGAAKDTAPVTIEGKTVAIYAEPGATLDRDGDGPILEVRSANTDVSIYDLRIAGASGAAGADGVLVTPNGGSPKLTLVRAKLEQNQGAGVASSGGTLAVTQSTVSGNTGGGILMSANGVVTIANNFIHHNGNTSTASAGGLAVRPMGASKIEFNTIVDNQANLGAASAGGVFCDVAGFVAPNNIIFRNTGGSGGTTQTFGNCTYGSSINMAGASATDNSLGFASPNAQPFDYHLTSTSPSSVLNAAGACTGVDVDGQQRPMGSACENGADEVVP